MTNFYKIGVTSFQSQKKQKSILHAMFAFFMFFFVIGLQAQTTLINPATDGGFNSGTTFASNGWMVGNEGTGPIKWALGTAASGITASGATTSGSATFTLAAANPAIMAGQFAYGFNIPNNTFVVSVSGATVTLSQNASTTATNVVLGFSAFPGSVNVNATQLTSGTITIGSYTLTLAGANPNIAAGMLITPIAGIIDANTYVSSVSGTSLRLSKATIGGGTAQTLNFTANGSAISGNAAYITNDNGVTNSYGGNATNRTIYMYRDITTAPASEKAMTLSFDVKSPAATTSAGWQVWVAPISQSVIGTNTQVTLPGTYGVNWPGATMIAFAAEPQVSATKMTAFIPKSFAGTSFRLIFVWTNNTSSGTVQPVAIDNISLTSRAAEEITAAQSGLWSMASTWDGGKVPTHVDTVVLDGSESVIMDSRYTGCEDLILAGANALLQFGFSTVVDEFTIYNDMNIAASGARFNNHDGTNGKHLKLGHNLDVGSGARFDSNIGSTTAFTGRLTLNGSTVQNVTVDPAGFFGGSVLQPQTAASTNANQIGVLNQLDIDNTATAASNVVWNVPVTRIKSNLFLRNARVNVTTGNRFVIGNFGNLTTSNLVCNSGSGFTNGLVSKWLLSGNTYNVTPGTEYPGLHNDSNPYRYPFISPSGADRTFYVLPDGNGSPAGEIAVLYTNSNTVTSSLSIADGSYTINKRFEGNYTVSTPNASATPIAITFTPNATTPTFRIGAYLNGAFEALDGTARFMNQSAALAGTHQDGTNKPFVFRKGLSLADLTAAPIYVGVNDSGALTTSSNIVSASTGDWNATATWVGGVVPGCTDGVTIASGHTVTVTTTANAANLVINSGGTLVNNSAANNMTVGCTNNNAIFNNYGTHTMTSGKLFINGAVSHKTGSFFNQTGGEIIVDSNNNGAAASSVAFGGTSFRLDTSNLNLTDGKITIVDPLVNIETTAISATSIANFSLNTQGAAGVFVKTTTSVLSTNSFTTSNSGGNMIAVGQVVTGHANIPAGTTVLSTALNFSGSTNTVTLSQNVTGSIPSGTDLNFSSMLNGNTSIVLENATANTNLAVGQVVSGNGIQTGTTIASIAAEFGGAARVRIVLSLPVLGLATSPITAPETLSFSAVNVGSPVTVLTAANPSIQIGMPVTGTGILPGTIVANIEGAVLTLSEPVQAGAPNPLVLNFYTFNTLTSGSFIYNSTNHYATGLNHTLQIGDGVSTQNTSIITNGFNCQFQAGGGLLSLGNLTVDAPNGTERFMNVSSNNLNSGTVPSGYNFNVQNNLTITSGSVFNKVLGNAPVYVGGNIINNGTLNMPRGGNLYLGNIINGALTPSAIPQTISGSGTYLANEYNLNGGNLYNAHSVGSLTVNNTSAAGVTIGVPNFRVNGLTLTNGIVHTTATNTIYCGAPDVLNTSMTNGTFGFSPNVVGSATCHIDGPIVHSNKADASITQNRLFPVGKNGKYLPISVASTGGVELMVEAFDTNTGTTSANASNMSANRWKVTRVGTAGAFTGYNVRLGSLDNPVTSSSLIVHAATESGVYDIVSTPASLMTYDAAHFSITNLPTIALTTAQTGGFLGNFSYAEGSACTGTPTPGATVASSTTFCNGQSVVLSLATATTGSGVTYQWQSSVNAGTTWINVSGATAANYSAAPSVATSYQCIVTCGANSATSTPIAITPEVSTAVVPNVTTNCSRIANLIASGASLYNWYDAATGGNLVATGASYSPTLSATTNYYVTSVTETASSINTTAFSGSTTGSTLFAGITFDVTKPIKLKTVKVYPKNTALRTPINISLYDASGNVVAGTSAVTFTPSLNTGTAGTVSQDVTLNYNIPVGNGYRLVATSGLVTTNNLLGNSTAAITYPTGTTLVLKGNVTNLTAAPVTTPNTTTYFHNLTFDEICESVTRTAVTATLNTVTPIDVPTITSTAATCSAAGSATVSNYDSSLTYVFSPTGPSVGTGGAITGATAGTAYTVTSGNVNCTSAASASFTNAAQLTTPAVPTLTTVAASCTAEGSATVSNYDSSLTYTFSPTGPTVGTGGAITGATAGTAYTVTSGNGTCTSAASASFTNAAQLTTPAVPTLTTVAATCTAAGSATVSNYDSSLTYVFSPTGPTVGTGGAITGATAGTAYTVTAGNGTCTSVASASFTNAAQLITPAVPTGATTQNITAGIASEATIEDLVVTGSNGFWYSSEANALATTNALTTATQLVSGTTYYTVNVSSNGCVSVAFAVTVTVTLGTDQFEMTNIKFYPNPVVSSFTIEAQDIITSVEVYNSIGQLVYSEIPNKLNTTMNFESLPNAIYFVKVISNSKNKVISVIKK